MSPLPAGQLSADYRLCRRLNSRHGKTFYLATGLLPAESRPHVHALYGFARYADDIVDQPGDPADGDPATRLAAVARQLGDSLAGRAPADAHPVIRAVTHTVHEFDIEPRYLTDFLSSMTADLTVARYPTFTDLQGYMWGSASVIGLQLLPILGVVGDRDRAEQCASDLGVAFQLTNFLRDVGEDYQRGRIYLPLDTLTSHGVDEAMLAGSWASPELRAAVGFEIARARDFYRRALPGIEDLGPSARDCVRTAAALYGEILDEIERAGCDVLVRRARVSQRRRVQVGGAGYLRAVRARHGRAAG